jgi:hypothetical protein
LLCKFLFEIHCREFRSELSKLLFLRSSSEGTSQMISALPARTMRTIVLGEPKVLLPVSLKTGKSDPLHHSFYMVMIQLTKE